MPRTRKTPNHQTAAGEREVERLLRQISDLQDQIRIISRGAPPSSARVEALQRELDRRQSIMEREREFARDFQQRLLPAYLPRTPGVAFAVHLEAAEQMGGDIYDIYEPGPGCIGFFSADPSGHGLRAALLAAVAKNSFDTFRVNEYSPKAVFEKVNLNLVSKTPENQFLTGFLAIVDCATFRMRYVNASHADPIVYGKDRFEVLSGRGFFLGLFDEPEYEEREIQLRPDDRLLIYSDGFTNALDAEGHTYSAERLHRQLRENRDLRPGPLLMKLFADLKNHLKGQRLNDDASLISSVFTPAPARIETIEIEAEPTNLPRVVMPIMKRLKSAGYGERAEFGIQLALEEALINAMKHGNKMDRAKRIRVRYALDNKKVTITVTDEGKGFDPHAVPDPTKEENLEIAHGRGLLLMRAYLDEVKFNRRGNEVTLTKYAPWEEPGAGE